MLKPFSLIFFVAVMVWMGAIFVSADPQTRMDRFCIPVEFARRAATGGMGLVDDGWGASTNKFFDNMHYGCRYVMWRMFYEEEWDKAQQKKPAARPEVRPQEAAPAKSDRRMSGKEQDKVEGEKPQKSE